MTEAIIPAKKHSFTSYLFLFFFIALAFQITSDTTTYLKAASREKLEKKAVFYDTLAKKKLGQTPPLALQKKMHRHITSQKRFYIHRTLLGGVLFFSLLAAFAFWRKKNGRFLFATTALLLKAAHGFFFISESHYGRLLTADYFGLSKKLALFPLKSALERHYGIQTMIAFAGLLFLTYFYFKLKQTPRLALFASAAQN